jgi:hypothetical protein
MSEEVIKKEALFNEVKGSLFEFLVAKNLALKSCGEFKFLNTIDKNYLAVLTQQDRLVRQFYPEMLPFLQNVSKLSAEKLCQTIPDSILSINLVGKLINSNDERDEADVIVTCEEKTVKVSLKLNKQGSFVNTKSGGIKSFFSTYFPFLPSSTQFKFNEFVDVEFSRMAYELHQMHDLEFNGSFRNWIEAGLSELPGELSNVDRSILKSYYSRIAFELHRILKLAAEDFSTEFQVALLPILGFSSEEILQLICFHDFKSGRNANVLVHDLNEIRPKLQNLTICDHQDGASVDINFGTSDLQIRVKPMNKFTTTAIKINCSVKY